MKFGHPRVYNPWQSEELSRLTDQSGRLMDRTNSLVKRANLLITEQRIVQAQMRDCHLTWAEQIARLAALDEVGAPQ